MEFVSFHMFLRTFALLHLCTMIDDCIGVFPQLVGLSRIHVTLFLLPARLQLVCMFWDAVHVIRALQSLGHGRSLAEAGYVAA